MSSNTPQAGIGPPPAKRKCIDNVGTKTRTNTSIVLDLFDHHPTDISKAICKKCEEHISRGRKTRATFTTTSLLKAKMMFI